MNSSPWPRYVSLRVGVAPADEHLDEAWYSVEGALTFRWGGGDARAPPAISSDDPGTSVTTLCRLRGARFPNLDTSPIRWMSPG